jgi:hypothetical protein
MTHWECPFGMPEKNLCGVAFAPPKLLADPQRMLSVQLEHRVCNYPEGRASDETVCNYPEGRASYETVFCCSQVFAWH